MGSVDPLDVGIVLAIPAFVGIVGSYGDVEQTDEEPRVSP